MKKRQPYWLSQSEMAKTCDVSLSGFQKWRVPPVAKIGRTVYYTPADVLANRLAHQEARIKRSTKSVPDQELIRSELVAKLALTKAQREGQELNNNKKRAVLADVDLIRWVIAQAGSRLSKHLGKIPRAVKKGCPKLRAVDMQIVKREVTKAQKAALRMTLDLDEYYESQNQRPR